MTQAGTWRVRPDKNKHVRLGFMGLLLLSAGWMISVAGAYGQAERRVAVQVDVEGAIGPATARHIDQGIELARARSAEILILRMNTPGGLVTSMREIIASIIASPVPVIGFVAPSGAHAASAGTYILYATHVAAMAPGTNIGAATPIQLGGTPKLPSLPTDEEKKEEKPKNPAESKAVNDAVAFIRSLAELRGRNAEWAEKAVRQAASLSANEALKAGVIDLVVDDVNALLDALDGRTITFDKQERKLHTRDLSVERLEPDFLTELLSVLSNPNVALILLMIGTYGLIFELATPGSFGPGIIGIICLLLALYALNQLPLSHTGLALLVLGIGFMVAEALTPSFGVLALGGIAAFMLGSAMLIDTDIEAFQPSWWVIGTVAALSGLILSFVLGYAWRAYRRPASLGRKGLMGSKGTVIDWSDSHGNIWIFGERWRARYDGHLEAGQMVEVTAIDGLTLAVTPVRAASGAAGELRGGGT
jgi:membrane-bound serine protease (ClpP class)